MNKRKIASLEIYNNRTYIIPTMTFLDAIVNQHAKLEHDRYNRFRFVVEEVLIRRIERAYPGKRGIIEVELFLSDRVFEVSIKDKGIPAWQDFSYRKETIAHDEQDLQNFILDTFADGAGMEKLGKDGQRFYLQMDIHNPIQFQKPEPYAEEEVLDTNITIRPVETKEEAIEAIRCIYSEYGYSYSYECLYHIDSFMQMIRNGNLMSFLLVNDHGQTAGHFALAFSDLYKDMPELSTVVTRNGFRGLGLFSKIINYCFDLAKERHFRAIMGQPVGFHPMSQKAFYRAGFTATSLLMSYIGADIESEYNKEKKRLDLCSAVRIMDPEATTTICPPKELVPFISKIYDRLGWKYDISEEQSLVPKTILTREDVSTLKMSKIIVSEVGEDLKSLLEMAVKATIRKKNEMIELVFTLSDPGCERGYQIAKECGFVLSGMIPGASNGDYLIMQTFPGDEVHYEDLVLIGDYEEIKNDILELIKK